MQETGTGAVASSELREEREMETTSDLRCFDLWSLCEVLRDDGDDVLA